MIPSLCDKGKGTHRAATARSACLLVILEESWAGRACVGRLTAASRSLHARHPVRWRRAHQPSKQKTFSLERASFERDVTKRTRNKSHANSERHVTSRRRRLSLEPNGRKLAATARQVPRGIQIETSLASAISRFPSSFSYTGDLITESDHKQFCQNENMKEGMYILSLFMLSHSNLLSYSF